MLDWKSQLQKTEESLAKRYVIEAPDVGHLHVVEQARENQRRARAAEDADQRTVIALETMLREAQASKADNARMLSCSRIATWASIAAIVLAVEVPVVQAMWPNSPLPASRCA